ncbi:MAG: triose-phosphate isomerase family protein [bacterium]|nr:triose-phosphate isomerase family protein [bacterium]
MKNGKKLIIANWKMNPGTAAEARALFLATRRAATQARRVSVTICPPFPFVPLFSRLSNGVITLGSQDAFWRNGGPHTGEVSPEMLKDIGVTLSIVGHSERRARWETDDMVSRKAQAVVREGLSALVCIGERARDENGDFFGVLREQMKASFSKVQRRFLSDIVIAYEPLWAISKNWRDAASPAIVRETTIFIRKVMADMFGEEGVAVPILYGGSVGPENAGALLRDGDISGFLVGHESLDAEAFAWIIQIANDA